MVEGLAQLGLQLLDYPPKFFRPPFPFGGSVIRLNRRVFPPIIFFGNPVMHRVDFLLFSSSLSMLLFLVTDSTLTSFFVVSSIRAWFEFWHCTHAPFG